MRFSELAGKELIDVRDGVRLGELGDAELVFEAATGFVRSVVVSPRRAWWQRHRELVIPWRGIKKIGIDLIMVDLGTVADYAGEPEDRWPWNRRRHDLQEDGDEESADGDLEGGRSAPPASRPAAPANGVWRAQGRRGEGEGGGPARGLFFFRRR